jgi:peptide/nickel transport system substrate-binding protein
MGKRSKIFRLPKVIRKRRKDIDELSLATENSIEKHFFRRLANLAKVRRFLVGWVTLMLLLLLIGIMQIGYLRSKYQQLYFVPGGTFKEGIIGSYTNANPIYASSSVDSSVSKLIFSGLFSYDSQQKLAPDLAEKMTIDKTEKVYSVTLKPNLYWQDGQPLTADDVVFTFKTIENPDAKSPFLPSWQGIKVESKNARTVVFTLPSSLSSFPDSLTTGIIPKHLLQSIAPDQLRSNDFNTIKPVGSGPFKYDTVEVIQKDIKDEKREQIALLANDGFHGGKPAIRQYIISTYNSQDELLKAYDDKKIDAISQLGTVNDKYIKDQKSNIYSVPIAGQTLVFFKTSQDMLADPKVRKALVLGANRPKVIESTGQVLKRSDEPLLISQTGYDSKYSQKTGHPVLAQKILDGDGWKYNPSKGVRTKKADELRFKLYALSTDEYSHVANELKKQWAVIGVDVEVNLQNEQELKDTVSTHGYDMLLSTISIGADPDVFAFWHSSQADVRSRSRLNFSEYKSREADASLEAGRSRSNPRIRAAKYQAFLKSWNQDSPALTLYQPNYTFIVHSPFSGFDSTTLSNPIDRYSDVEKWMIRQQRR